MFPSSASYVLGLMFLFNAMNFLDRMLFAILQEPIRRDLSLTDTQLGLIGGPAFSVLYALAAIPAARIADRGNRARVISGVLALWSVMTGLCGAAAGFGQLLLCRLGVSIGEAGCAPAAHSLIASHFPSTRRAGAISLFTSGTSVGTIAAAFGGGALAQAYGWRVTFYACAIAGVVLAILIVTTVRDVGQYRARTVPPSLTAAVAVLRKKRTFLHLTAGMALATLSGFAIIQYLTSFLMRAHGLTLARAAGLTGLMIGVIGFVATIGFGVVVDRTRGRYPRLQMMLPAVAVIVGAIGYIAGFLSSSLGLALPALAIGVIGMQSFLGVGFALAQDLSPSDMRSTTAGLLMLVIGLVGYAIGSPLVGLVSDAVASRHLAGTGLVVRDCARLVGNVACARAQGDGLRAGLVAVTLPMFWASLHFRQAARTMLADVAATSATA